MGFAEVDRLLSLAIEFECELGLANSPVDEHEQSDGGSMQARIRVGQRWPELEAAVDAAARRCPGEAIALQTSLADALHHRMQAGIKPARDALRAAACRVEPTDTADKEEKKPIPDDVLACMNYIIEQNKLIKQGKRPAETKQALIKEHLQDDNTGAMERAIQPSRHGWYLEATGQADK